MKVKEIVKMLVEAENYAHVRFTVDDGVIELIKDYMPMYYDLIQDREEAYQLVIKELLGINNQNNEE